MSVLAALVGLRTDKNTVNFQLASTITYSAGTNLSDKERRLNVKIRVMQDNSVIFHFDQNESPVAVAILRGIYRSTGFEWVRRAIVDLERELAPKQLTFTLSTRICEKCFCEVDIKSDNAVHYTGDQDKWVHKTCPQLKENRPV